MLPSPTYAMVRPASFAEPLLQREQVGHGLARVLFVGQRVDHVQTRRGGGELLEDLLRERADDNRIHPALEVARDVGRRLASAERHVGGNQDRIAPQLTDRDLEGHAGAQRRLVEEQRDVSSRQRRLDSTTSGGARLLESRRLCEAGGQFLRRHVGQRQERARAGRLRMAGPCRARGLERLHARARSGRSRSTHVRVLPVNPHVLGAQVAGPHHGVSGAPGSQVHVDVELGLPQVLRCLRRLIVKGLPVLEEHDRPHLHARVLEHEARARTARRRHQPAPVRIGAVNRGLHQRRVGDGLGRPHRVSGRFGARDVDRDQLGGAFAAAHDRQRQCARDGLEAVHQRAVVALVDGDAAAAAGQRDKRVVGRALAVHRDRVEGAVGHLAQRTVEQRRRHVRIRRHKSQHGRHHRLDHACAFGDAPDPECAGRRVHLHGKLLRAHVGGHDAARGIVPVAAQRGKGGRRAVDHLLDGKVHADDAGGGDQHLLDRAAHELGDRRPPSRASSPGPGRRCRHWRSRCSRRRPEPSRR